jgi:hypothetical protein
MKKQGRPPTQEAEAREFGRLVEAERKPGEQLKAVFLRIYRRDPRRWGSAYKMRRLWKGHRRQVRKATALPGELSRSLAEFKAALPKARAEKIEAVTQRCTIAMNKIEAWLKADKVRLAAELERVMAEFAASAANAAKANAELAAMNEQFRLTVTEIAGLNDQ